MSLEQLAIENRENIEQMKEKAIEDTKLQIIDRMSQMLTPEIISELNFNNDYQLIKDYDPARIEVKLVGSYDGFECPLLKNQERRYYEALR